jgi:NAD(P)-dependent dehydrogenase (short-subunit alcohol dehydrogenase family)
VACTDSVATPRAAAIIDAALDRFGRIDMLMHNAGNVRRAPLAQMSYEDFDAVLDVHLRGRSTWCARRSRMRRRLRPDRADLLDRRAVRKPRRGQLCGQGRDHRPVNVVALEGAAHNVTSNVIVPGRGHPDGRGHRHLGLPADGPDLVAPAVGWLAHEKLFDHRRMLVAIAGRIARVVHRRDRGVYQPSWSIEDVGARIDDIRDTRNRWSSRWSRAATPATSRTASPWPGRERHA